MVSLVSLARNLIFSIIISFGAFIQVPAQSVRFYVDIFETALQKAEKENKPVFIDTHAKWCVPCKKMDVVFRDPRVADFFNEHFINVKIDMDEKLGKKMHMQYHVVFLPTLLILDHHGNVQFKSEGLLNADQLMSVGKGIIFSEDEIPLAGLTKDPEVVPFTPNKKEENPAEIVAAPPTKKDDDPILKVEDIATEKGEKILYVLNEGHAQNPDILYQEAYFRMQLMDGSHHKAAKSYLTMQKDWSTEKTMRFIFDFLYDTDAPEFNYFMTNRYKFEELLGTEQVRASIEILVYQKLFRGYPRPGLKTAQVLFSYIDPINSHIKAHQYYLDRLLSEQKPLSYKNLAEQYIVQINPEDHFVHYQLAMLYADKNNVFFDHRKSIELLKKALALDNNNFDYYRGLAMIYSQKGFTDKSKDMAKKAIEIGRLSGKDLSELKKIIEDL